MRSWTAVLAALIWVALSAMTLACPLVAANRDSLEFLDDGENSVLWRHASWGGVETCYWLRGEDGTFLACDGKADQPMERTGAGALIVGGAEYSDCAADGRMRWSESSVPPFPDIGWAGNYRLDAAEPEVLAFERLVPTLIERGPDVGYVAWLVTTRTAGRVQQDLQLWMDVGGDSYLIYSEVRDARPIAKLVAEGPALATMSAQGWAYSNVDWQRLAEPWVSAHYANADAWSGVMAGEGPIPWGPTKSLLERHAALDDSCRGGADEARMQLDCDARQDVAEELFKRQQCLGREGESSATFTWHSCGEDSLGPDFESPITAPPPGRQQCAPGVCHERPELRPGEIRILSIVPPQGG